MRDTRSAKHINHHLLVWVCKQGAAPMWAFYIPSMACVLVAVVLV